MSLQADPVPQLPQVRLDYAPAPPRHRKFFRRAAVIILTACITFAAWRWGRIARDRVVLLYVQHQCLTYAPSADKIVYEEEPGAAAKLLASGSEYAAYPINRGRPSGSNAAFNAAAHVPTCWSRMRPSLSPLIATMPMAPPSAVIFLHERTSPSGHRRLVCVHCFPDAHTFNPQFIEGYNYESAVIIPATLRTYPKLTPKIWAIDVLSSDPPKPPNVRVYAGQIDPHDASKFTIRYEIWGQADVLDGQLMDDDQVKLKPRHTPDWPR